MKNYGLSSSFLFERTFIDDLLVIKKLSLCDYDKYEFERCGLFFNFVQDNESFSYQGVLRGIDLQLRYPQAKLVKVLEGEIFDVAVDLRKESRTYGKWFGITLSRDNNNMLYVPKGFGHGLYILSNCAKVSFKVNEYYHPEDEICIHWNDLDLDIKWPVLDYRNPVIKERKFISFREYDRLEVIDENIANT